MRNTKSIKAHIPNFITSINLLLGCISVVFALQDELILASYLIFVASLLDFLDGLAARLFDAYSEFGKMLDSLADVVSFGVAPSAILYKLINIALVNDSSDLGSIPAGWIYFLVPCCAFIRIHFGRFSRI